jgi:hypothetical protein
MEGFGKSYRGKKGPNLELPTELSQGKHEASPYSGHSCTLAAARRDLFLKQLWSKGWGTSTVRADDEKPAAFPVPRTKPVIEPLSLSLGDMAASLAWAFFLYFGVFDINVRDNQV